jgi:hypothetical protein
MVFAPLQVRAHLEQAGIGLLFTLSKASRLTSSAADVSGKHRLWYERNTAWKAMLLWFFRMTSSYPLTS